MVRQRRLEATTCARSRCLVRSHSPGDDTLQPALLRHFAFQDLRIAFQQGANAFEKREGVGPRVRPDSLNAAFVGKLRSKLRGAEPATKKLPKCSLMGELTFGDVCFLGDGGFAVQDLIAMGMPAKCSNDLSNFVGLIGQR